MRKVRLGTAVLAVLAVTGSFVGTAAAHDDPTMCSGQLSGVTVERLVVPVGQTCTATDVTVSEDVRVRQDATLDATNIVVDDGVRVGAGGSLLIGGMTNEIGDDVIARDAVRVGLSRSGLIGSSFHVGGDVVVTGAEQGVGIGGLTVEGDIVVRRSGAENGIGVNGNVVGGSILIVNNTIVGAERPSDIDVFGNTVEDDLVVSHNDATNAFEPTFVGSNTIVDGDLVCRHNIPEVVNDPPGGPFPNTVLAGRKLGQCADL
jgi:hypothetical protein